MLSGRTIVITGAARGVGRAIAEACARHGARLILCDVLREQGERTATELRGGGASVRFAPIDLADPHSIAAFAADIARTEGVIHGLVNNAAIATQVGGAAFEDIELDLWDRVMAVNVRGTWLVTRALSALFAPGGHGRIVNLASDTALWGPPKLLAYVSSKGAVISMTRSLARELGTRGIGVTAVAPGIMRNEATEYVPAERHQEYERGRAVPGPQFPEDIVEIVAFLLTPAALALTGQVLPVDAGFVFT
ncbi:MAG TPA: SDR family oxidoreductase [Steroidobacteraceae bacterium]|nr:SDR family oxidoreductase [Steroidobacteraceae bacterium]